MAKPLYLQTPDTKIVGLRRDVEGLKKRPAGPLVTTDGTLIVKTDELLIGAGITLTNPTAGVAELTASGGSGIQFGVANSGSWLDVTTASNDGSGWGVNFQDSSPGGILLQTYGVAAPVRLITSGSFDVLSAGGFLMHAGGGSNVEIEMVGGGGTMVFRGDNSVASQILIGTAVDRLGFYGNPGVVQPAAPTTLAQVIAALSTAAGGCGITA